MKLDKFLINLKNKKYEFFYKRNKKKDDSQYFQGILLGRVYKKINLNYNIDIIIDIGANIGSASIFFSLNYPESTIFSFEPVSETYEILKKNTKNFNNIFCYKSAITSSDNLKKIYIDEDRLGRSSLIKNHRDMETTYHEIVKTIDLNKFLDKNNIDKIDILKIDSEGSEKEILDSIKEKLNKVAIIYIEIHGNDKILYLTNLLKKTHNEIDSVLNPELKEAVFLNKIFKINK